jgi:hypothetical protein
MGFSKDFHKSQYVSFIITLMTNPWLLVALFIFHDGEEVLFLPRWVENNAALFDSLEKRLPTSGRILSLLRSNNQKQFSFSVLLLLLLLSLISGAAAAFPSTGWVQNIFIGSVVIFTSHLVIHVAQCVFAQRIIPGAITSVIVFVPSLYLWLNYLQVIDMSFGKSLLIALLGAVIFLPLFPLVLKLGHRIGQSG